MSLPVRPTLLPQCTSCLRRISNLGLQEWKSGQQIRGKKKMARMPDTVTVRLLKDVQTFGRKGAFVPITIGQMRNEWFPRRVAEYVTDTQMKELRTKNVSAERDFQFGILDIESVKKTTDSSPRTRGVEVEMLTPERSIALLSILLPPRLDFFRQPKEVAPPTPVVPTPAPEPTPPPRQQRERGPSNAAADLLAARSAPARPTPPTPAPTSSTATSPSSATPIFGSVSTGDVASAMKAALADNHEASRIVFGEQDVTFVNVSVDGQPPAETDRVRHLGEFEVQVKIRGSDKTVSRIVRVLQS